MIINFESFISSNISLITFFAILILLLIIIVFLIKLNKNFLKLIFKLNLTEKDIKDEIRSSVQPKFIEVSMEAKDLMDLAVEFWRVDQRLNKTTKQMSENTRKAIENSMQKIKKIIGRNDLEVRDYTGQKYNTGMSAIDVISVEKDKKIKEDIVKETIEPSILLKGQIVRKAKVILLSNN